MIIARETTSNKFIGVLRIMLGIMFLMPGMMKLILPDYGEAWSIQLVEANIPLYTFIYWFVPFFEVVLGLLLLLGHYSRISALLTLPIMLVAIYVHLTVINPGAFPSQPQEPYAPIAVIMMAIVIIIKGGGAWSMDLKHQKHMIRSFLT